jgi:translation initiation factor 2B subunit (eIF-2B alpha/beta/delta family)
MAPNEAPWTRIVDEIKADKRSGATALLRRAAEALRLLAAQLPSAGDEWREAVAAATHAVATARPPFAGLRRLASAVRGAVALASSREEAARQIFAAVDAVTGRLDDDGTRIVARAARLLDPDALQAASGPATAKRGRMVLTLSASSLVERTLLTAAGDPTLTVACLESRPMLEGAALARRLAEAGVRVVLTLDALGPALVVAADLVMIGGDTLAPDGLVHKVGTFGVALAASRVGVPVYALIGPEKLLPSVSAGALTDGGEPAELLPPDLLAAVPTGLEIRVPYFDLTPLDLLTGLVMPDGIVVPSEAARLAAAVRLHPALADPRAGRRP